MSSGATHILGFMTRFLASRRDFLGFAAHSSEASCSAEVCRVVSAGVAASRDFATDFLRSLPFCLLLEAPR